MSVYNADVKQHVFHHHRSTANHCIKICPATQQAFSRIL